MASKQLTASVRLNVTQAERSIDRLVKKINRFNTVLNQNNSNNTLHKNLNKSNTAANNVLKTMRLVESTTRQTSNQSSTLGSKLTNVKNRVQEWHSKQKQVNSSIKSSNTLLGSVGNKLKSIAATYLGIMGAKAVINTSDTITSAQNKLNNIDGGNPKQTAEAMDKIYSASQRARTGYSDMLSNVSKTMTLAGDSFQGNIDNAIRFQEIMAKAYTVGGASAEEQSTSMYQLVQALGSGILQGDELRSVREGAPIAYKKIEEFAQGVFKTEESLKDLASQGVITSDIIVAAIMDAEEDINKKFENTKRTFAQTWDSIKNTATKAFEPVLERLNDFLNSANGQAFIDGLCNALVILANVVIWVFDILGRFFRWCADNWEWLKYVVGGALLVIIALMIKQAAIAIWSALQTAWAFLQAHWPLLLIVGAIMAILYVYELWRQGAMSLTEALVWCAIIIATAFLIAGIIMMSIPMLVTALVIALLALIFYFFEQVCYGAGWLAAWIVNIVVFIVNLIVTYVYVFLTYWWNVIALVVNSVMAVAMAIGTVVQWIVAFIVNLVMGCVNSVIAISHNCVAAVINVAMALWNSISAICQNIGIAFSNAWNGALSSFWNFIADCIDGLDWLSKPLEAIAELFGKSFDAGSFAGDLRSKANQYQQKEYVSLADAWSSGMNTVEYKDVGDAWSSGWNTMDYANMGDMVFDGWRTMDFASFSDALDSGMSTLDYVDANEWGSKAGDWGAGVIDAIDDWGSQFQTKGDDASYNGLATDLSNMLGLNKFTGDGGLPDVNDPAYALDGAYDPTGANDDIVEGLDKIGTDTDEIKDKLDLSNDDLDYLRSIAEKEWRNEFTTAEIKVEMTNNNTVNGERDLDGIVSYLSDVLREEMSSVAYGVHY